MKPLKAKRINRKGQASVEYLVVLAIAIVIAVVAVGVLVGFIKIGTATTYKKKGAVYWRSADIGIMDWEIHTEDTNSTLILQNNKEYQIHIDWIDTDSTATISVDRTLIPGDTYKLMTTVINCSQGGSYSFEISYQYDNKEHSVDDKKFTGVEKMAGTCHEQ
ncbi:MAG: class III signal peptide-containing protein [Candidatus Altiarchaeales archaeon]|nr:class III signal peptide-containing protein [Candidatus Altiarchaeales archaeon]